MISGHLCYLLTNKTISRLPDSERNSNNETIQNKNKTKTHNKVKRKSKLKEQRLGQHKLSMVLIG
jgi:hypothetical protein